MCHDKYFGTTLGGEEVTAEKKPDQLLSDVPFVFHIRPFSFPSAIAKQKRSQEKGMEH